MNYECHLWGESFYKILIFSLIIIIIPIPTIEVFSYRQSSKIVQQKVSISNLNTVKQVGERIEFIFQDAHDLSLFLIQNEEVRSFFNWKTKIWISVQKK